MINNDADLHTAGAKINNIPSTAADNGVYEAMEEDDHQDLWQQDNLLDVNDPSMFYAEFPPLPDFPCMSSSSSSSSTPAATIPTTATSSSSSASSSSPAANWGVIMNSDSDVIKETTMNLSSTASMEIPLPLSEGDLDCLDVMHNFGYMDLMDSNDIWDPSSVFQNTQEFMEDQEPAMAPPPQPAAEEEENDGFSFLKDDSELALIFFEWLKQNKDYISAGDMRNIKLKRSTIESASKRLGSTKEGKKQLLKLILEWVGQYQLQKKREVGQSAQFYQENVQNPDPIPNSNPNINNYMNSDPDTCFSNSPWMPPPQQVPDPAVMVSSPPAYSVPMPGYVNADPYSNPMMVPNQVVNGIPYAQYPQSGEYPAHQWATPMFPIPPYPYNPVPDNGNVIPQQYRQPYQLFDPNGERLVRLGPSATKEARKKRMARQRRLYSHHHRHSSHQNHEHQGLIDDQLVVDEVCEDGYLDSSTGKYVYWAQSGQSSPPPVAEVGPLVDALQSNSSDQATRPGSSDRRQQQGWKTEKNLKFLLQKVLKQSDVGNLGRIVLPKKEAESHLPELESRDGIPISMEDIGTSRVWNMRYRFWPNNKSRMYLLENTGDFVRANGLQEGDFIVIYSDTKCGKYMIRGVKVRQPETKAEGKKTSSRRNVRNMSFATNTSSLTPIKQAVR